MAHHEAWASLAGRMGNGSRLLSGWIGMPDPLVASHLAQEKFDMIVLDMQHGQVDSTAAILGISQIVAAGKPAIVRIPVGDYATASRMLDAGASGIIAPMISTPDEARALVAFTKYPPLGERSFGPAPALNLTGLTGPAYLAAANQHCLAIAMIETRAALDALDEILAIDGIDGVFLGPYDLSIAFLRGAGIDPTHPEVEKALDKVLERCRARGKYACVMAGGGERAKELRQRGFDMVAIGPDVAQLRLGAQTMIRAAQI